MNKFFCKDHATSLKNLADKMPMGRIEAIMKGTDWVVPTNGMTAFVHSLCDEAARDLEGDFMEIESACWRITIDTKNEPRYKVEFVISEEQ